jgi:hypothetical protein
MKIGKARSGDKKKKAKNKRKENTEREKIK